MFETKSLPQHPSVTAPDGSDVGILLQLESGSKAHFELKPGKTSLAVMHETVEENWNFLGGQGEMWRKLGDQEKLVRVEANTCITIPRKISFQFRSIEPGPLAARRDHNAALACGGGGAGQSGIWAAPK